MLHKNELTELYIDKKMSSAQISLLLGCSTTKVNYWLNKHEIPKRSVSDAVYARHNPNGDPFSITLIDTIEKAQLYGLGIGLYWGEGTKANRHSIRLGNSDPSLLRMFMRFLTEIYGVSIEDMKFGLQIFSDIEPTEAIDYWVNELNVDESQFYKVHITKSGSLGTYRAKSKYGVVTLYYHNKKLRDIIVSALPR